MRHLLLWTALGAVLFTAQAQEKGGKDAAASKEKKYEDAIKELELIVTGIEQENISIEYFCF